jgi:DNA-binding NarL/FixJ family response regulator
MTRVVLVADSGPVMAALTQSLCAMRDVEIARHASGRAPIGALVGPVAPDLAIVDEMSWFGLALARVAEIREAAPNAVVIVLAHRPLRASRAQALRAGATSVLPRDLDPVALGFAVREVLNSSPLAA